MFVVDPSLAAKWFIDEQGSDKAKTVLLDIQERPEQYIVIELFFVEMLSILSRTGIEGEKLKEYLGYLEELGLQRVALGHEQLMIACNLVKKHAISSYDAQYISLAQLLKGKWLTCDAKAHAKIQMLGVSQIVF